MCVTCLSAVFEDTHPESYLSVQASSLNKFMFVYTEHKCNMHAHRAQWSEAMAENKMQGWLKKESHDYFRAMRKWQWRYFVLDFTTKRLSYYLDESLADQRGEYELDGSVLSEVPSKASAHILL